jgi:hypothetical protein
MAWAIGESMHDYQFKTIFFSHFHIVFFLRLTESIHVKTNLIHKLQLVQIFGITKLEGFKDLLTPDQYFNCLNKGGKGTWYTFI